jgi:soluble lytic murein transglycosylase-like protein
VDAGVRHLKQLLEEFNYDIELTLAAYNVGSGMVRRHQGIPPIKATQYYVKKVFAYYRYYKNEAISQTDNV